MTSALQRMEPGDPRYAQAIEAMAHRCRRWTNHWRDPENGPFDGDENDYMRGMANVMLGAGLAALEAEGWSLTDTREEASMDEIEDMRQRIENDLQRAFEQTAEIERLREALRQAYADIIAVNCAGFDSARGSIALAAITRISKALSSMPGQEPA